MTEIFDFIQNLYELPKVDQQNIFYFFSTAAQSVAAVIAFIIAGYALVYQAMDNIENKDETRVEVHHELKVKYHKQITIIAWLTGITIVLCLIVLWLNGTSFSIKRELLLITAILVFLIVYKALAFVIDIIDPNKLRKVAIELLKKQFETIHEPVQESKFAAEFIRLERDTKDLAIKYDIPIKTKYQKEILSLRDVVESFYKYELLTREEYDQFRELIKYRNLVFHGHVETVDKSKVEEIKVMKELLIKIKDELERRFNGE